MENLYAFYFVHLDDDYSTEMKLLCPKSCSKPEVETVLRVEAPEMAKWLAKYPNGKVEYHYI